MFRPHHFFVIALFVIITFAGCSNWGKEQQSIIDREQNKTNMSAENGLTAPNKISDTVVVNNGVFIYTTRSNEENGGGNINYLDSKEKVILTLCSRIECLHSDDTCTSWFADPSAFLFTNDLQDELYILFTKYIEDVNLQEIYSLGKNGLSRELLYSFPANTNLTSDSVICNIDSKFYFITQSIDIMEATYESVFSLIEFNPKTKSVTTIETFDEATSIIGVEGRALILSSQISRETDITKGQLWSIVTQRYSIESQSGVTIFEYTLYPFWEFEVTKSIFVANGNLYMSKFEDDTITINPIENGAESKAMTATLNVRDNSTTYYLESHAQYAIYEEIHDMVITRYAVNLDTGEIKELTLRMEVTDDIPFMVGIVAEIDDIFLVVNRVEYENGSYVGPMGDIVETTRRISIYAFLDKNDYFTNNPRYYEITYVK